MMSTSHLFRLTAATILVGLALLVSPAFAEKRVALVIGNGAYKAAGRLANPVTDASDMASALRSLGFQVDMALDVDRAKFETTISDFSDKATGADVALVFYAGHGMGLGTETHLLPVDADFRNEFEARNRTIGLTALLGTLEGRAKTVLAFVDACRDNPLADRLAGSMRGSGRTVSVTRGLARIDVGASDTLVVYATTPGRTAADGTGRNSPFTTALLAHLGTEGVEIEVLLKRVSARVQELTGNQQEPERLSRLKREFYFKPVSVVLAPPGSVDLSAVAAADFDRAKSIGTVAAWDLFLSRHPRGYYADLARQAREKVTSAASFSSTASPSSHELSLLNFSEPAQKIGEEVIRSCKEAGFTIQPLNQSIRFIDLKDGTKLILFDPANLCDRRFKANGSCNTDGCAIFILRKEGDRLLKIVYYQTVAGHDFTLETATRPFRLSVSIRGGTPTCRKERSDTCSITLEWAAGTFVEIRA